MLRSYGVVVSISGCDPLDPGSTPGTAILFFFFFFFFFVSFFVSLFLSWTRQRGRVVKASAC